MMPIPILILMTMTTPLTMIPTLVHPAAVMVEVVEAEAVMMTTMIHRLHRGHQLPANRMLLPSKSY
jgi:hypothetical protein